MHLTRQCDTGVISPEFDLISLEIFKHTPVSNATTKVVGSNFPNCPFYRLADFVLVVFLLVADDNLVCVFRLHGEAITYPLANTFPLGLVLYQQYGHESLDQANREFSKGDLHLFVKCGLFGCECIVGSSVTSF
mmetsp:Transcript_126257/g.178169  ORF Transcript_126257/g.178169 Transcript_126257/m.178169 type:complete len:134 (+) Transcript_126257:939-1340(+)